MPPIVLPIALIVTVIVILLVVRGQRDNQSW